jgi:foldase protein PrsA
MALMRHASIKMFCVLAVTGIGAAVVTGCGNDVPPNAVAKVGDSVITQDEFDKWMKTASAGQAQGGAAPATPDPPDFKKCVAAKKKQPVPKGQDKPSDSQLKKQCKQQFDQLKTEVMQFLIQSEWVQGEANRQGIRVSERRVRRALERQKDQAFPTERAYRRWLQKSGMTHEMIMFRVRLDVLQRRLTAHVTRDIRPTRDPRVRARRQQRAIERFIAGFRARWEGDTVCAPGYVVQECGGN